MHQIALQSAIAVRALVASRSTDQRTACIQGMSMLSNHAVTSLCQHPWHVLNLAGFKALVLCG